jgi:hypothetical protein
VLLLLSAIPVSGQNQPRLLIPKNDASERPIPQLTPSGRYTGDYSETIATPLLSLPRLEQPAMLPAIQHEALEQVIREGQVFEAEFRWIKIFLKKPGI